MNVTLLRFVLVFGCAAGIGCENPASDSSPGGSDSVQLDLELASVTSTLAAGDVISEVTPHGSAEAWTVVWPWDQLAGEGRAAPHSEATPFEVLEGCNEIAYVKVFGDAQEPALTAPRSDGPANLTADVSAVMCSHCHQTLNHRAPL